MMSLLDFHHPRIWPTWVLSLALFVACLAGCVTKSQADARARAAFAAGQQQALTRPQLPQPQDQNSSTNVVIIGAVRNNMVPWTEGLTLGGALLTADYIGQKDPNEIIINRNGLQFRIEPRHLLSGEDVPLEPRDIIEIR